MITLRGMLQPPPVLHRSTNPRIYRGGLRGALVGLAILLLGGCATEVAVPVTVERGCAVMSSVMPQQVSPRDTEQTRRDALTRNRVWGAACPTMVHSSERTQP